MILKVILYFLLGWVVSFYLFPFGLNFLPEAINTKNLLAILGIGFALIDTLRRNSLVVPWRLLGAVLIASLFSAICFIAIEFNDTNDLSYVRYIVSFFVWIYGAFAVIFLMKTVHKVVDVRIIINYLVSVCVAQCCLALLIDNFVGFQFMVDSYINQGQDFLHDIDRLYGIGASLDNAGTRFAVVLSLIPILVVNNENILSDKRSILFLLLSFFIITFVGNMISRTTIIGSLVGIIYILIKTTNLSFIIEYRYVKLYAMFAVVILLGFALGSYLFNVSPDFSGRIRFAFEGFFNWVDYGEWRTDSTDKLNREMWVWPSDLKTWIIGAGLFEGWVFSTDIGYCRFIFYCGLIGFLTFCLFFIYNSIVLSYFHPNYKDIFLVFLLLTFVIWLKVSTDLFMFYALFYFVQSDRGDFIIRKGIKQSSLVA